MLDKNDPMNMFRSAKAVKIVNSYLEKEKESVIHSKLCKWLKLQYPDLLFMSDFAAGLKLSQFQAVKQSIQKSDHSFPDLIIFEPRALFHGLFIELKRDKDSLFNKNGTIKKSEHLTRQQECHELLRKKGYKVEFACGFDESVLVIREYLSGF